MLAVFQDASSKIAGIRLLLARRPLAASVALACFLCICLLYAQSSAPVLTRFGFKRANAYDNLHMTQAQCKAHFPRNAEMAHRTRRWYDAHGRVTWDMVINAARAEPPPSARLVLRDNRLYISDYHKSFQSRAMAILMSMASAVIFPHFFVKFLLVLSLIPMHPDRNLTGASARL